MSTDIFLSVGQTWDDQQEAFVSGLEGLLRVNGLTPKTVGRNDFSASAPLTRVLELMETTAGTIVCAFERTRAEMLIEKRGSADEKHEDNVLLPTVWNQIEAAMTYTRGQPLLVIVDRTLKTEGLLAPNYDWYVAKVDMTSGGLQSIELQSVLSDWCRKVQDFRERGGGDPVGALDGSTLTLKQLATQLPVKQVWAAIAALLLLLAAVGTIAFQAGQAAA